MHTPSPQPPVAIIVSRYNDTITSALTSGAIEAYQHAGGDERALAIIDAPGAFELSALALHAAWSGQFGGIVALGCIVQGKTRHDRYLAAAVAEGLTQVTIQTRVPVAFGVLTVKNIDQAYERAGGTEGNKGAEAMNAVLASIAAIRAIQHAARTGQVGLRHSQTALVRDKAH